jgi:hypothetical protein
MRLLSLAKLSLSAVPLLLIAALSVQADEPAQFRMHSVTENQTTYQVHLVDINQDGLIDILGTTPSTELNSLYWYENPTWERHVLAEDLKEIILWVTSADIAGDSTLEVVALAGFSPLGVTVSTGELYYLQSGEDIYQPWHAELVDRIQLAHRGTLADFDGDGVLELAVAPVAAGPADHLDVYAGTTPLIWYRLEDWRALTIKDFQGHLHGMTPVDWDGDGGTDLLTAGLEGIWLHQAEVSAEGPQWTSTQISPGKVSDQPFDKGTSDMRLGRLTDGTRFIVAPEPWHSGEIFVYIDEGGEWVRHRIEDQLDNGHAIATADLNGDGEDEIIIGNRTGDMGVYVYYAEDAQLGKWTRTELDNGEIGGTDCNAADINNDGLTDLVCGGHFSNNIRWYENLGSP